ncbi:hypothetical protein SAMN05443633_10740 [Chryseobacterium arachidis]|uniref:Uncharacterized protein n=1 Tax=Chryseobacterium arachidis TaxID=1416778 RepID=A0A1M5ESD6_9FLAO|nr:hypothetical protein [Chryseobacterium arachidis]SHF82040.1 hypothetical protein SAMN05443633_10740 [Chryseobacterium arachidis]
MQKIIKTGKWKYSGNTYLPILLVEQDWDHFYKEGYSHYSSSVSKEDVVYFLHFGSHHLNEDGNISSASTSKAFLSVAEAVEYAERNIEILNWNFE